MNEHFKNYSIKLADTYHKDMRAVSTDLINLEGLIHAKQYSLNNCTLENSYFLLAAGKLSREYKNGFKQ